MMNAGHFVDCLLAGVCLIFSHNYIEAMHFWPEDHVSDVESFSVLSYQGNYLITDNVNFHHLV